MKILTLAIAGSLAANVVLLAWSPRASRPLRPANESPAVPIRAAEIPGVSADVFSGADPAALRDALRAAGAGETETLAIVEGALRSRHRAQVMEQRLQQVRSAWWRIGESAGRPAPDEAALFRSLVTDPLRQLFGRDPREVADAENRYPFLPPEKRRRMAEIDLDYAEMLAQTPARSIARVKTEMDQERLLMEEQRKDVLATLSLAERAEYELRFEGAAMTVSRRLATYAGSEAEFRSIKPEMDELDRTARALPKGETFSDDYGNLQQAAMDRLVARLWFWISAHRTPAWSPASATSRL